MTDLESAPDAPRNDSCLDSRRRLRKKPKITGDRLCAGPLELDPSPARGSVAIDYFIFDRVRFVCFSTWWSGTDNW